ncbi:hypothetical protein ACIQWV_37905 [Streptomyces sp. NPDC098085]|uniref:hypothetical protein n=1 Tax=Streptomyces sp. NPDC098085 TaxID=3366094 RepID=UPI00380DAD6F
MFQLASASDRPADLGDSLAAQLMQLLERGLVARGDVLTDNVRIVTALGGRMAAAKWARLVLIHVAQRYNLLRYRPPWAGGPVAPVRASAGIWIVSEAALVMASVLAGSSGGFDGEAGPLPDRAVVPGPHAE